VPLIDDDITIHAPVPTTPAHKSILVVAFACGVFFHSSLLAPQGAAKSLAVIADPVREGV